MTGRLAPRRVTPQGVLVARYDTPREEWLELRRQGIGGSDALAVLGLDRWTTRMEVYLEKIGQPVGRESSPKMRWGQMVEATIGQWFTEQTGIRIRRCGLLRHRDRPWQQVSVDYLTSDGGILEIKNRGQYRVAEWDDDQVDDGAEAQGQHALAVTGYRHSWFAAQLAGEPPEIRRVERDNALIADMTAVEEEFWQLVQDRTPPALEGRASPDLVRRLFPGAQSGKIAEIDGETYAKLLASKRAQRDEVAAERLKKELTAQVQFAAGDAEILTHNGRIVATWKNGEGRRSADYDQMEKEFPEAYAATVSRTPGRRFLNKLSDADIESDASATQITTREAA